MFRQLGTNLVVPGGARVIEAKGRLIIPGMSMSVSVVNLYSVCNRETPLTCSEN